MEGGRCFGEEVKAKGASRIARALQVGLGEIEVVGEGVEGALVEEVLELGVLEIAQQGRAGGGDVLLGGGMVNVLGGEGVCAAGVSTGSKKRSDDTHIRTGFHPSPAGGSSSFRSDWLAPGVLWPTWVRARCGSAAGVEAGRGAS